MNSKKKSLISDKQETICDESEKIPPLKIKSRVIFIERFCLYLQRFFQQKSSVKITYENIWKNYLSIFFSVLHLEQKLTNYSKKEYGVISLGMQSMFFYVNL